MAFSDVSQSATAADGAIRFAVAQVGKPYKWAAAGPNAYDCSGLVMAAYKTQGISLPHFTGLLINYGHEVAKANLQPGDLVFPDPGHVQIYVGNGKIVEAPEAGKNVRVVNMWGFWRARRIAVGGHPIGTAEPTQSFGIPSPGDVKDQLEAIKNTFAAFGHAAEWISSPHNWLRIGEFALGVILLFIGMGTWDKVVKSAS